jgi:hypothetical protein
MTTQITVSDVFPVDAGKVWDVLACPLNILGRHADVVGPVTVDVGGSLRTVGSTFKVTYRSGEVKQYLVTSINDNTRTAEWSFLGATNHDLPQETDALESVLQVLPVTATGESFVFYTIHVSRNTSDGHFAFLRNTLQSVLTDLKNSFGGGQASTRDDLLRASDGSLKRSRSGGSENQGTLPL